jgi:hypothetical protein
MEIELPDMFPTLTVENVDEFLLEMTEHDREIRAGVAVVGDAAGYAEVWEWGNARQKKPGPKTVIGMNPKGKMVWLSIQAPFGYIRINEPFMSRIVDDVMAEIEFNKTTPREITLELEKGARKISKAIAQLLSDAAPKDSGNLARSIVPIDPNDALLDQEADEIDSEE